MEQNRTRPTSKKCHNLRYRYFQKYCLVVDFSYGAVREVMRRNSAPLAPGVGDRRCSVGDCLRDNVVMPAFGEGTVVSVCGERRMEGTRGPRGPPQADGSPPWWLYPVPDQVDEAGVRRDHVCGVCLAHLRRSGRRRPCRYRNRASRGSTSGH